MIGNDLQEERRTIQYDKYYQNRVERKECTQIYSKYKERALHKSKKDQSNQDQFESSKLDRTKKDTNEKYNSKKREKKILSSINISTIQQLLNKILQENYQSIENCTIKLIPNKFKTLQEKVKNKLKKIQKIKKVQRKKILKSLYQQINKQTKAYVFFFRFLNIYYLLGGQVKQKINKFLQNNVEQYKKIANQWMEKIDLQKVENLVNKKKKAEEDKTKLAQYQQHLLKDLFKQFEKTIGINRQFNEQVLKYPQYEAKMKQIDFWPVKSNSKESFDDENNFNYSMDDNNQIQSDYFKKNSIFIQDSLFNGSSNFFEDPYLEKNLNKSEQQILQHNFQNSQFLSNQE